MTMMLFHQSVDVCPVCESQRKVRKDGDKSPLCTLSRAVLALFICKTAATTFTITEYNNNIGHSRRRSMTMLMMLAEERSPHHHRRHHSPPEPSSALLQPTLVKYEFAAMSSRPFPVSAVSAAAQL